MLELRVAIGIRGTLVFLEKFPDDEEHAGLNEFLEDIELEYDFPEPPGVYLATLEIEHPAPVHEIDPSEYRPYLEVASFKSIHNIDFTSRAK